MKELSLNVLDIAKNSVSAKAKNIDITLVQKDDILELTITDDGDGMTAEKVKNVINPFFTTRTTRKVGLGIPFLKLAAEQTGGNISIESTKDEQTHGTKVKAIFNTNHIDFEPIGDIVSTIISLIQGSPDIDFCFNHICDGKRVFLDTKEMKSVLGDGISLAEPDVLLWIKGYLEEQYQKLV